MTISFTIPGAPRTKKNSGRIVQAGGRPRILPSKAFEEWNKQAQIHLMLEKNRNRDGWAGFMPFFEPVNCSAVFYRQSGTGDAVGYYQALADALQEAGIVEDDALIVQWDGSRMLVDKENPRIEVELKLII